MGGTQIPENLWRRIMTQCDSNSDGEVKRIILRFFIDLDFICRIREYSVGENQRMINLNKIFGC